MHCFQPAESDTRVLHLILLRENDPAVLLIQHFLPGDPETKMLERWNTCFFFDYEVLKLFQHIPNNVYSSTKSIMILLFFVLFIKTNSCTIVLKTVIRMSKKRKKLFGFFFHNCPVCFPLFFSSPNGN